MTTDKRPVFGVDRDPGVVMSMHSPEHPGVKAQKRSRAWDHNRMVDFYGAGPDGAQCGSCVHLYLVGGTSGRYYKCDQRPHNTASVTTDHRVRWPACRLYEQDPERDR